jgi:hypothetical protein
VSKIVKQTGRIKSIVSGRVDADSKSFSLLLEDSSQELYALEFGLEAANAILTAYVSHLTELLDKIPEQSDIKTQILQAAQVDIQMSENGTLALSFRLEGGAQLQFSLPEGMISELSRMISELETLASRQNH